MKKKLPNFLTISRVFLALGFIFCLLKGGLLYLVLATVLFIIASLTDYFDGYLAKKNNVVSNFGKIMDPIADKILMLTAFYLFMQMGILTRTMFFIIFAREVIVTGSRFIAMKRGKYLAAEKAGKYKTGLQITSIIVILLFLVLKEAQLLNSGMMTFCLIIINLLIICTVALTLISGITYMWNNREVFISYEG